MAWAYHDCTANLEIDLPPHAVAAVTVTWAAHQEAA
jgi:hypothetical protein